MVSAVMVLCEMQRRVEFGEDLMMYFSGVSLESKGGERG